MAAAVPPRAGIGLRHPHVADFLRAPQPVGWIEVHSENYLAAGGPRLRALERLRRDYPLSCHGVGLSLGSAGGIDPAHARRLRVLYDRLQPGLVSEHLAWSVAPDGSYLNDLLPLPYTDETLAIVRRNVEQAQVLLGRRLLVENPSAYVAFAGATLSEAQFLAELVSATGCGLLLDVNNLHVSAQNQGSAPLPYLAALPAAAVGEIHVAGHRAVALPAGPVLVDDHAAAVSGAVWDLLEAALRRTGPQPVLVEWDARIPPLSVLLAEAAEADRRLARATPLPHVA